MSTQEDLKAEALRVRIASGLTETALSGADPSRDDLNMTDGLTTDLVDAINMRHSALDLHTATSTLGVLVGLKLAYMLKKLGAGETIKRLDAFLSQPLGETRPLKVWGIKISDGYEIWAAIDRSSLETMLVDLVGLDEARSMAGWARMASDTDCIALDIAGKSYDGTTWNLPDETLTVKENEDGSFFVAANAVHWAKWAEQFPAGARRMFGLVNSVGKMGMQS